MKKVILTSAIVAASVLALSSCQDKLVPVEGAAVQSEIAVKSISKTAKSAIDGSEFPSAYDMLVSAYWNASIEGDEDGNFFEGAKFQKVETSWKGQPARYWPLSGNLDFLCIACAGLKSAETGVALSDVTWGEDVTSEVSATMAANTNFDDVLYGAAYGQQYRSDGNPIEFKHAQAAVVFNVTTNVKYDEATNYGINVNKITVNDVFNSGTFTVTNTKASKETSIEWDCTAAETVDVPARVWTLNTGIVTDESDDLSTFVFDQGEEGGPYGPTIAEGNNFGLAYVILPGQAATSFTINYTLHNGTVGDKKFDNTISYTHTFSELTWEPGKKYIYNIKITLQEITIIPTVINWDDADQGEIEITNEEPAEEVTE